MHRFDSPDLPPNLVSMSTLETGSGLSPELADLRDMIDDALTTLVDAEDQILQLSDGGYVDEHGEQTLRRIRAAQTRLRVWVAIFGTVELDAWAALGDAETVIADWKVALRKGYVQRARKSVFGVMQAARTERQKRTQHGDDESACDVID